MYDRHLEKKVILQEKSQFLDFEKKSQIFSPQNCDFFSCGPYLLPYNQPVIYSIYTLYYVFCIRSLFAYVFTYRYSAHTSIFKKGFVFVAISNSLYFCCALPANISMCMFGLCVTNESILKC